MLSIRHTPLAPAALALALLVAPSANARAAKAAAPALSIESKVCNIGPTAIERNAVVTAKAAYSTGARVSMKFTMQQRTGKAKWRSVLSKDAGLGVWETTDGESVDLRYTKTINGLVEGTRYRVVIDARGVDESDKAVTKTARKYVSCTQPLFTPTIAFGTTTDTLLSSGVHQISTTVRNIGRLPSGAVTLTAKDAVTRTTLGTVVIETVKGNGTAKVAFPLSACTGRVLVTATLEPATDSKSTDAAAAVPDPSTTVTCATASGSSVVAKPQPR